MTEAHTALQTALAAGEPITLSLATLRPRTLLEWLAASEGAARMTLEHDDLRIVVEVSNGLVVGATADTPEGALEGRPAYERLRHARSGSALVEPLRFPSLANILVPVHELPELQSVPPGPIAPPDTVVIPLPAARPVHVPDPTMELELPDELVGASDAEDRWDADEPTIEAAMQMDAATDEIAVPVVPARPVSAPAERPSPTRRSRGGFVGKAAAAAVLVLSLGLGGAVLSMSGEDSPSTASAPAAPADDGADMSFDLDELPDDDADVSDERTEARTLARLARRQLRAGESAEALTNARRAASLRRHLPYYQVLLGDALRANGQRRAARRAYRRALRMRPDYAPAQRRLGRSATLASRMETSDQG